PYDDHRDTRDIMAEAAADIRARFWQDGAIADDAHATIDISDGFGADAVKRMLVILGRIPQDPLAIAAFTPPARTPGRWWTANDDDHRSSSRNFDAESGVSERLQEFLLRTSPEAARDILAPILAVIDRHSRELQTIMQGLTGIQDSNPNTAQYWFLWRLFAD